MCTMCRLSDVRVRLGLVQKLYALWLSIYCTLRNGWLLVFMYLAKILCRTNDMANIVWKLKSRRPLYLAFHPNCVK